MKKRKNPGVRKYKAYLIRNRICCRCGSNRTDDRIINHVLWHREYTENREWTGNWKCHKCYMKDYQNKRMKNAGIIIKESSEKMNIEKKLIR